MPKKSTDMPAMQALTRWLREHRERQGLTMRDLGARLGLPHSYVQKVEQGERRLDVVEYARYCQALSIPANDGIALIVALLGHDDGSTAMAQVDAR